jgi:hypothetical protein
MYVAALVVIGGFVGASPVGGQSLTQAPPPAASPAPLIVEEDNPPYRTALGYNALNSDTGSNAGLYNTALGYEALYGNTTGERNTATGEWALFVNTLGNYNTATGNYALLQNTTGSYNAATGATALYSNTTGNYNTATGMYALFNNQAGGWNTAVGYQAGYNAGRSDNIFLGSQVQGTAADVNTMRLGLPFDGTHGQNQTFIAGIYGTALPPGSFVPVYINAAGQLGTALATPAVNGGQATGIGLDVLAQQLQDLQTTIADLRAELAELKARVGK